MKAKSSYIRGWSQKEWGGKGAVVPVFAVFSKKSWLSVLRADFLFG